MKTLKEKINENSIETIKNITVKKLYNALSLYKQYTNSNTIEMHKIFGIYTKDQPKYINDKNCIITLLSIDEKSKSIVCKLSDESQPRRFPFDVNVSIKDKQIMEDNYATQIIIYIFMELIKTL